MFLSQAHKFILDLLFPIECLGCHQADVWLCSNCLTNIKINPQPIQKLDLSPSFLDGFLVASDWNDLVLQEVVHKYKYNFVQELAAPLADLLAQKIIQLNLAEFLCEKMLLVPVPLHRQRYAWRGFNQAELLAENLTDKFNIPLNKKLIVRSKNTSSQVKLPGKDREKNILNAFSFYSSAPNLNKNILLIDDIITTGATMNEIAKLLKSRGIEKVWGLALAKG